MAFASPATPSRQVAPPRSQSPLPLSRLPSLLLALVLLLLLHLPPHCRLAAAHLHRCHHLLSLSSADAARSCLNEWTIVTAASANHFCPLEVFGHGLAAYWAEWDTAANASASLARHHVRPPRLVIYDLGLEPRQLHKLKARHARAWTALAPYLDVQIRRFEYEKYPPHLVFSKENPTGQYAWKAAIVGEVADETRAMLAAAKAAAGPPPPSSSAAAAEYRGVVMWLDSGVFVQPYSLRLHELLDTAKRFGFTATTSGGNGQLFTHPAMYGKLNLTAEQQRKANATANVDASRMIFDLANEGFDTYGQLVAPWRACALERLCIAPAGSSRENHRQDQSVISALAATRLPAWPEHCRLRYHRIGLETQREGGWFCK